MNAYIGLGSNLGDRPANLIAGLAGLSKAGLPPLRLSSVWDTEPVDTPGSGQFLNMVAMIQVAGSPLDLLDQLMQIEAGAGRIRTTAGAPRSLDLDLLMMGDLVVKEPRLTLPHPRMWLRSFVLEPLAEIAPDIVNLSAGRTVAQECLDARGGPAVRRVVPAALVEQDMDSILRLSEASTYNPVDV